MATVPGEPDGNVTPLTGMLGTDMAALPKALQPTQGDFLMAAAIMHQQGKFGPGGEYQVAGDVVPFPTATQRYEKDPKSLEDIRKIMTRDTLSRALGGTQNILPIAPKEGD
jgi:hypothetical protein